MIWQALSEAADRCELLLVQDGMCRFHLRRDGVVTIRELLVLPFRRGTGVGRTLLCMIREQYPTAPLVAWCPATYESNGFWQHMGFKLASTTKGINEWRYPG